MINNYLSADELAAMIGCRANSYACMRRWLARNGWPYVQSITGFPTVSRAYHDARMAGVAAPAALAQVRVGPNFGAIAA